MFFFFLLLLVGGQPVSKYKGSLQVSTSEVGPQGFLQPLSLQQTSHAGCARKPHVPRNTMSLVAVGSLAVLLHAKDPENTRPPAKPQFTRNQREVTSCFGLSESLSNLKYLQ